MVDRNPKKSAGSRRGKRANAGPALPASPPIPIFDAGMDAGIVKTAMARARKITVEIPPELLDKAQKASGADITQTVRTGLQLVAASQAYEKLLGFRGKISLRTDIG